MKTFSESAVALSRNCDLFMEANRGLFQNHPEIQEDNSMGNTNVSTKTKAKKAVRELKALRRSKERKSLIDDFGRCCRCCRCRLGW